MTSRHPLDIQEERLAKAQRLADLQWHVDEKRARLKAARHSSTYQPLGANADPATIADLKKHVNQTPLDGILQPLQHLPQGSSQASMNQHFPRSFLESSGQDPAQQCVLEQLKPGTSEMFLKPAQLPKGEVFRIVDFVDNIVPREDERSLSDGGNTKLIVSYGPKKPKLDQVTMQQWVVSNTRIFYNLLVKQKLQSVEDIQHYLAYTIKIMELANRFQWVSVLKYDDEFRLLQASYNYLWSFDSNHLHTGFARAHSQITTGSTHCNRTSSGLQSPYVLSTSEERTICRNFNSSRGCSFTNCVYEHICNRRVSGGKACGLTHLGFSHNSIPTWQLVREPTTQ